MALSEHEKQVLAEMERHLREQDPKLADAIAGAGVAPKEEPKATVHSFSPRRIALGSILAAAGLAVVLGGVTLGFSVVTALLGAVGFLMMVGGVLYALQTDERPGKKNASSGAKATLSGEEKRQARWKERGR